MLPNLPGAAKFTTGFTLPRRNMANLCLESSVITGRVPCSLCYQLLLLDSPNLAPMSGPASCFNGTGRRKSRTPRGHSRFPDNLLSPVKGKSNTYINVRQTMPLIVPSQEIFSYLEKWWNIARWKAYILVFSGIRLDKIIINVRLPILQYR